MTYEEFGKLMETKGVQGKLELWDKECGKYRIYGKLEYDIDNWIAHIDDWQYHTELSDLEYREKQTPGQEFDSIMVDWKQSSHNVDVIAGIIEWRNKHKDLLDED